MWKLLTNYSDKFVQNVYSAEEDKPIINLIERLRKKDFADSVYCFTSLWTFVITLQNEYNAPIKDSISVSFDRRTNKFSIGYGDVKANVGITYNCVKNQAESLVDAFVLRLFLTENNEFLKIEAEEKPSFHIGQQVETVVEDYSRHFRKGKICEIVKHQKQNRFMYFIEVNGKKLKKRYFKDNLRET